MKSKTQTAPPPNGAPTITLIPRTDIAPSPTNARKDYPEGPLRELAESIKAQGIVQPLIVRPRPRWEVLAPDLIDKTWRAQCAAENQVEDLGDLPISKALAEEFVKSKNSALYELVAGERRWRAAGLIKEDYRVPCLVRDLSDADALEVQAIENAQRADLKPLEEAAAYQQLITLGICPNKDAVAERIHKSRSHVYQRLALLTLPAPAREAYEAGRIDVSVAELVARVPGEKDQKAFLKRVLEGGHYEYETTVPGDRCGEGPAQAAMSFRAAKHLLFSEYLGLLKKAPFDIQDAALTPAGACADCPKRSGNCTALYPEVTDPNVCTDRTCWAAKKAAHVQMQLDAAAAKGLTALTPKESRPLFSYGSLAYNSGHVKATEVCDADKQKRTYQQLAKAANVPLVAAAEADTGKVHTLVNVAALAQACPELAKKDVTLQREAAEVRQQTPEEAAKAELEAKIDNEAKRAVLQARFDRVAGAKWNDKTEEAFLRLLAEDMEDNGATPRQLWSDEKAESLGSELRRWKAPQLRAYLVVCMVDNYLRPAREKVIEKLFPVDEKAIRKEVTARLTAEAKKEKPAPEKPAKKKK